MLSTLVGNSWPFYSPNYLTNPKPGEKRNYFNSFSSPRKPADPLQYIFQSKPFVESLSVSTPSVYMAKYGNRMPFHVPPIKMPPLVGGFVGAKSQCPREDTGKLLWEVFARTIICTNDLRNMNNSEDLVTKSENAPQNDTPFDLHTNCSSEVRLNCTSAQTGCTSECSRNSHGNTKISVSPNRNMSRFENSLNPGVMDRNVSTKTDPGIDNNSILSSVLEDKDKPPMKKPKLTLKKNPCNSSKRKHKGKKNKKCRKNAQCDPVMSLGYDPTQSTFECVDEVDCGLVLTNRFAPLENAAEFHMWCESPTDLESSDSYLLNLLNEMHLDDVEADFDSTLASHSTEHNALFFENCDTLDHSITCNSEIAFILSGNDDMTSDSEDGSYVSDIEELQWQCFKEDFEYFQDKVSLEDILGGASEFHCSSNLEVLDDNDNYFLNDLEQQLNNDMEQRLQKVNQQWNLMMSESPTLKPKSSKVIFAPDSFLTQVHSIPCGPEERQARKGMWDQCYLDKCRFQNRIKEVEPLLSACLTQQHRKSVFQRLFGSDELATN